MTGRLNGKRAVITGAAQGIGLASVEAFTAEGARVWAVDRNRAGLEDLSAVHPAVEARVLDVTDGPGVADFAADAGEVDVLFNCAGYVHDGPILECSSEDFADALEINVTSMYLMIKAFLPGMLAEGGGSIINMSSVVSSVMGVPNRFAYGTSKAAVIGLTKAVAADYIDTGIRCNAIAPGTVDTPSLADRLAAFDDPDEARRAFVARQPLGRLGTAAEIAAVAVHLASDESAYTTGTVHVIDGGMSL